MQTFLRSARLPGHLFWFALSVSLLNLMLFQQPLLSHALPLMDGGWPGFAQMVSLQSLQIFLLLSLFLFVGFFSATALKLLITVLFIANACALYFMWSYGVVLDITMMRNVFETNQNQATELFHPLVLWYVFCFAVIPLIFVWNTRVRRPRWYVGLLSPFLVLGLLAGILFATSTTWLWYDKHSTSMGARILPWSYAVNSARHFNKQAMQNRNQVLLPALQIPEPTGTKQVVVLVIGEAVRAQNLTYYGYDKDTTPFTATKDIAVFPPGKSCATFTIGSTACILTHQGSAASSRTTFEPITNYLTRHGIDTIWRSNAGGTPPIKANVYERAREIAARCEGENCPAPRLDGALFSNIDTLIQERDAEHIFITLHLSGSHGPSYHRKYPADFEHFTPVCRTVQLADCNREELFNAYDNTLRYTDYLLAQLIDQLGSLDDVASTVIYTADHGQSLGEGGLYLHGAPTPFAPDVQRVVPFLVWMSERFKEMRGLDNGQIIPDVTHPHDFPFHSILGAFGMTSEIYKPQFDVFALAARADSAD